MNDQFFSEYRRKDYIVPRSMREAYGQDFILEVEEKPASLFWAWVAVIVLWLGVWVAYGWLR